MSTSTETTVDSQDEAIFQLSEQHDVMKASMGGLVLAPIDLMVKGLRVLDSGTADGFWLRDLMKSIPGNGIHELVGTDITDVRFPKGAQPTNLTLSIQSITEPWPKDWHCKFDLVHQRLTLAGCRNFPVQQAVESLCKLIKPGGWIQLVEPEQTCDPNDGPIMKKFMGMLQEVLTRTGMSISYASSLKKILEQAGLDHVQEQNFDMLLGPKNSDPVLAGKGVRSTVIAVGMFIKLVRTLPEAMKPKIPDDDIDSIVLDLERELKTTGANYPFRVVWGQKPDPSKKMK